MNIRPEPSGASLIHTGRPSPPCKFGKTGLSTTCGSDCAPAQNSISEKRSEKANLNKAFIFNIKENRRGNVKVVNRTRSSPAANLNTLIFKGASHQKYLIALGA